MIPGQRIGRFQDVEVFDHSGAVIAVGRAELMQIPATEFRQTRWWGIVEAPNLLGHGSRPLGLRIPGHGQGTFTITAVRNTMATVMGRDTPPWE